MGISLRTLVLVLLSSVLLNYHSVDAKVHGGDTESGSTKGPTHSPITKAPSSPTDPVPPPTRRPTVPPGTPTEAPTERPTVPPGTPTEAPTRLPPTSDPPVAVPTVPPGTPTASPSSSPTLLPSSIPSAEPTTSPQPTRSSCETADGMFGETAASSRQQEVTFIYAIVLNRTFTCDELQDTVLMDLEGQFTDSILSDLFGDCPVNNTRRRVQEEAEEELIGVSSRPPDECDETIPCSGEPFCLGVIGKITLFFASSNGRRRLQSGDDIEDEVRTAMQESMSSGQFDGQGEVLGVEYLGDTIEDVRNETVISPDSSDDDLSTGAIVGIAIGAAAFLCCILAGIFYFVHKRRNEGEPMGGFIPDIEDKVVQDPQDDESKMDTQPVGDSAAATGDDAEEEGEEESSSDDDGDETSEVV